MAYAPIVILHVPLSDERELDAFVEQCLIDGVKFVAVFGDGASRIEDTINEIVEGDGSDEDRFILTSSHDPATETLDDVLALCAEVGRQDGCSIQRVTL